MFFKLFQRLKNLRSLKIDAGDLVTSKVIFAVTQHLTGLKSLFLNEMHDHDFSFVSEEAIKSISKLKSLEKLYLHGLQLPINDETISTITLNCQKIKYLEFSKCF